MFSQKTIISFLLCAYSVTGFVLYDDICFAPRPCHCSGDKLLCDTKQFTEIPKFSPSPVHMDTLSIYLPANKLTTIPANSFKNINTTEAREVYILFQTNLLHYIDMDAFVGIEDTLVELFFQDNKFSSFPPALTRLSKLRAVHFQANPMHTVDPVVTSHMTQSLITLNLAGDDISTWPLAIGELNNLETLSISLGAFTTVPINAFCGLESLKSLYITTMTNLTQSMPDAVCYLQHLTYLRVNHHTIKTPAEIATFYAGCQNIHARPAC